MQKNPSPATQTAVTFRGSGRLGFINADQFKIMQSCMVSSLNVRATNLALYGRECEPSIS